MVETRTALNDGKPSDTARRVAAQRLTFQRVPVEYGDPEADQRLAADVAAGMDSDSPLRTYLEARTRFFDTVVVESIEAGVSQVLIGAAGYDGRAWRYAKPGVKWFEIDHPSTQRDKLRRLASLDIHSPHVQFIGADFAIDSISEPLIASGFSPSQPAVSLLEGVAVYLARPTLEKLLRQLAELASPGSVLAISLSVSTGAPGTEERRARFASAVERMGEPARTTIEPDQVEPLLAATGWRPTTQSGDPEVQVRYRRAGFVTAAPART
jgi:methyltransferase (TIGR00027 family)